MFRRSRGKDADRPGRDGAQADDLELDEDSDDEDLDEDEQGHGGRHSGPDLGDPETWTRLRAPGRSAAGDPRIADIGPWDAADDYPDHARVDLGSLLVPVAEGSDIQVNMDEQAGMWIAVVRPEGALQLQAFAAPKSSGLWDEVRDEIAAEVTKAGGKSEQSEGPFGTELRARITPPGQPAQAMRFMGVDGPRWFLRGLLTGPAAEDTIAAAPLEGIFADVVVVRGEHPSPPRQALEIRLPEETRQAIEQQLQAEQEQQEGSRFSGEGMPNPFERGPEINEIR